MPAFSPKFTTSGGKNVGAAVLARTSCQSGKFRLQSPRVNWLYLAPGLFVSGQGESVVALRITIISSVRSFGLPSVVSAPNSWRSLCASGSSLYL